MSGSYSMKGTMPAGPTRMKKGSLTTNGNGPPPLSYPADPPDDENMNEIINENIDITVHLPDGTQKQQTVESTVPMMDLLIMLAASNKLNPAAHSLKVLTGDKWKQIDFKANKTIGLLAGEDGRVSVQIVQKRDEKDKQKQPAQQFEMTYRFTVNLPHKQKKVLRISPKLSLGELRQMICEDKAFEPSRYAFLLPGNPTGVLEDSTTVGDLKTSEIDFVSIAVLDAASSRSMPNLALEMSRAPGDDSRAAQQSTGEKKAKRGFLSFLNKNKENKKVKNDGASIEAIARNKKSESFHVGQQRPHTMYESGEMDHFNLRRTTGDLHQYSSNNNHSQPDMRKGSSLASVSENSALVSKSDLIKRDSASKAASRPKSMADTLPKKSGKKRAAPPPPQLSQQKPQTVQVEIEVNPKQPETTKVIELPDMRVPKRFHSRNSSDSSGYHELTVSGADSPDGVKSDNLQTTLDTTSIDSADNFNGDSGIRDMSPVHRNRNKVRTKELSSRDSSLDTMDNDEGPVVPGRKKKRAPLPPPGMTGSLNMSTDKKVEENKPDTLMSSEEMEKRVQEEEEFAALQAMEEVTMKFNIEESDEEDDMKMVENSSIHSEDLDISHRQQRPPATFIAPPPPTEPPPEDSVQVDYNPILGTIDIGVGEDTTSLSPESSKSKLQNAMPDFKDQIKKLANEEEEIEEDRRSDTSEQDDESNASFIIHDDVEDSKDRPFEACFDARQAEKKMPESSEITYNYTVDSVPAEFQNSEREEIEQESDGEIVVEEIVEYFPVDKSIDLDSPRTRIPDLDSPKEHRSLALHLKGEVSDVSVDESEAPLNYSTPKDPKELAKLAVKEAVQREREAEEERRRRDAEEAKKRKEKEEFVISLDELSNVDFSAPLPEEKRRSSKSELPKVNYRIEFRSSRDLSETPLDYLETDSYSGTASEDVFDNDRDTSALDDSNVGAKTMCSDISFSPSSEGEVEHVLEEKSISMIALPAERTPVKNPPSGDEEEDSAKTYASATKIVLSNSSIDASASSSPSSATVSINSSPQKEETFDTQSLMQSQYQQLQSQFTMWQSQLMQNQKLLSNQDEQSNLQLQQLQLQMQMQQQMMMQLQQSMQTLALQNTMVNQQGVAGSHQQVMAVPAEVPSPRQEQEVRPPSPVQQQNVSVAYAEPPAVPQPPPPPPAPAPKVKPVKADAKYSKPKPKRMETQLDPREKLMLDIRNFGKVSLNKVPVKATHWHK